MLSEIKGIGLITEKKLNLLGVYNYEDLVMRLPKGYMDMSKITLPQDTADGDFCFFEGKIINLSKPFKKGKLEIIKSTAECENGNVSLIWFNRNYLSKILKVNNIYRIYGKIKIEKKSINIYNPLFEEKDGNTTLFGIQPIYLTRGMIPQKTYRGFVEEALKKKKFNSIISNKIELQYNLINISKAYNDIHFPETIDLTNALERIALEKITRRICAFKIAQKRQLINKKRDYNQIVDYEPLFKMLPFKLNNSQMKALERIESIFKSDKKVNAVLCGDVGSGKTIVAISSIYFVVKNGYKSAIMAPTEILAKQHYNLIKPIFSKLGFNVCFLSGSAKNAESNIIKNKIKNGFFDVIVGTHSLLYLDENIPNLSFVVTDEQHRFGVAQRTALISKGNGVDVLTLSATPIPRSMQLVAYGEIEYITIKKRFKNAIKTAIVTPDKRVKMWEYISNACKQGQQAYIIAPRIYDAEGVEKESVEALQKEIKKYFDEECIGILHGKMLATNKQEVLDKFYKNEISLLISTTVVEVGLDVPNASIITIMDAERFGLATLHQLRGRVGRNGQESYCFLYTANKCNDGLKIMCSCDDGFELAEKDFEMRGSGDIFGLEQSGRGSIGRLNLHNLKIAKEIAESVDLCEVADILDDEIKSFCLTDVSLT